MTMFNRYIINGLLATGVHYAVLVILLDGIQIGMASVANLIAAVHTMVMWWWADHIGWNYTLGFLVATGLQMAGSFLGNKYLVFKS